MILSELLLPTSGNDEFFRSSIERIRAHDARQKEVGNRISHCIKAIEDLLANSWVGSENIEVAIGSPPIDALCWVRDKATRKCFLGVSSGELIGPLIQAKLEVRVAAAQYFPKFLAVISEMASNKTRLVDECSPSVELTIGALELGDGADGNARSGDSPARRDADGNR